MLLKQRIGFLLVESRVYPSSLGEGLDPFPLLRVPNFEKKWGNLRWATNQAGRNLVPGGYLTCFYVLGSKKNRLDEDMQFARKDSWMNAWK